MYRLEFASGSYISFFVNIQSEFISYDYNYKDRFILKKGLYMTEEMLIRIKQLPPLPESAMRIEAIYHDQNSSFNMIKILEQDPLLTAEILHAVHTTVTLDGVMTKASVAAAKELIAKYSLDLESFEIALKAND